MAHYECSCCGERMGISHEDCSYCQRGLCNKVETTPSINTKHPSHVTRISDASSFDEICVNCGHTDITGGGWGNLAKPCPSQHHTQPINDLARRLRYERYTVVFTEYTKTRAELIEERHLAAGLITRLESENQHLLSQTWQPIETAPMDGTKIDIWFQSSGRMTDAFWTGNGWGYCRWRNARGGGHTVTIVCSDEKPTHWMRPPKPEQPPKTTKAPTND